MQTTKLTVEFIYRALIIKPRCRKPVEVCVRDFVEVEYKHVDESDMPVAFKYGNQEYRWFNNLLWDFDYSTSARQDPQQVSFDTIVANTKDISNYRWSGSGAEAPFHNIWHNVNAPWDKGYNPHRLSPWLKDEVPLKEDVNFRTWVDDNRQQVIDTITSKTENSLVMNNTMFSTIGEPRYYVICFGLGRNHGGTSLSVSNWYNSGIVSRSYFAADKLNDAKKYAEELAVGRGDNESIPFNVTEIEVLIPEAIRLNPEQDHGVL